MRSFGHRSALAHIVYLFLPYYRLELAALKGGVDRLIIRGETLEDMVQYDL